VADEQLSVVARLKAREGMEDRLREELLSLVEPSRKEEGCLSYDLHQAIEDPSLFYFYENWASQQDFDEHLQRPHVQEFDQKLDDLGELEIMTLRMLSSPDAGTAGR
jgi:quinol monooxygenase YgiN